MISYVRGVLDYASDSFIIVEASGVGMKIYVTGSVLASLPKIGSEVKIYTYLSVKEDDLSLFGFKSMDELEIFNKLISVSGVGPKGAVNIVSTLTPKDIVMAVISGDVNSICRAQGVGKKIAQRIILELKDKFKSDDIFLSDSDYTPDIVGQSTEGSTKFETIEALMSLGYTRLEAVNAVSKIYDEGLSSDELLKRALKKMI